MNGFPVLGARVVDTQSGEEGIVESLSLSRTGRGFLTGVRLANDSFRTINSDDLSYVVAPPI